MKKCVLTLSVVSTIAVAFFWCEIAQAELFNFGIDPEAPAQGESFQLNAYVNSISTIDPMHIFTVSAFPTSNFKLCIEGVEAGHFTSFDGLSVEDEVIDYNVDLEFSSDLPVSIYVRNPIVLPSDSFYLQFDVLQPGVGTSAYNLHWQSNDSESISFYNPEVVLLNDNKLSVSFGLISDLKIDSDTLLYTTEVSGDFTPVPIPSAVILSSLGLALSGWLLKRKRMTDPETY